MPPRKYESRSFVARVERGRIDAVGVLQVGADVRVGVVDGARRLTPGTAATVAARPVLGDHARRCGCDDVGAERELGVDPCLLVVGGGEDAEVDPESEQQPDERPGRG